MESGYARGPAPNRDVEAARRRVDDLPRHTRVWRGATSMFAFLGPIVGFGSSPSSSRRRGGRAAAPARRRTGELPELLIGLGVLGIGPVGFGFLTVGELCVTGAPGVARGS